MNTGIIKVFVMCSQAYNLFLFFVLFQEDLSEIVANIKDDGRELETSAGDGEDIPASEINDVIKRLKLDRFVWITSFNMIISLRQQ